METHVVSELAFQRMVTAVEKVRERLKRATEALEAAQIPYAVVEGNAVAAWVGEVDEAAVRNMQDVDILLRRPTWRKRRKPSPKSASFTAMPPASICSSTAQRPRRATRFMSSSLGKRFGKSMRSPRPMFQKSELLSHSAF